MIALSLDGNDIVLGDDNKMVRVLDMHTGEFVSGPYEGHTKESTPSHYRKIATPLIQAR